MSTCSRCPLFSWRYCWMRWAKLLMTYVHYSLGIALIFAVMAAFCEGWCYLWETHRWTNLGVSKYVFSQKIFYSNVCHNISIFDLKYQKCLLFSNNNLEREKRIKSTGKIKKAATFISTTERRIPCSFRLYSLCHYLIHLDILWSS